MSVSARPLVAIDAAGNILPLWGPYSCAGCGHHQDEHRGSESEKYGRKLGWCVHTEVSSGHPCSCKRFAPMKDRHPDHVGDDRYRPMR